MKCRKLHFLWLLVLPGLWWCWERNTLSPTMRAESPSSHARVSALPQSASTSKSTRIPRTKRKEEPFDAYVRRASEGLTDKEVFAIVDEFQKAGTTDPDWSQRKRRKFEWFEKALEEGLSLSAAQRAQLHESLQKLLEEKGTAKLAKVPGLVVAGQTGTGSLIPSEFKSPWKLCDLTSSQSSLTFEKLERETEGGNWFLKRYVIDPQSGEIRDMGGNYDTSWLFTGILPLTMEQWHRLSDTKLDLLTKVRQLHPAQLRLSLMHQPYLAEELRTILDFSKQIETSPFMPSE